MTAPPELHAHDPVVLLHNGKRVGMAWCPAEAYWLVRRNPNRYPHGTVIESLHRKDRAGRAIRFGRRPRAGEPVEVES